MTKKREAGESSQNQVVPAGKKRQGEKLRPICVNKDCRIRRAGCEGSKECPGYKGK